MRILMLVPHAKVSGPMPRLAALLVNGLRNAGCNVTTAPWGRHSDRESPFAKLLGRARDVLRVRGALSDSGLDFVVVQTSHEWTSIVRDLAVILVIRPRARRIVLQFHGGRADELVAPGHWFLKQATSILLRLTDGVFVLSSGERHALEAFYPAGKFTVVDNPFDGPSNLSPQSGEKKRLRDPPEVLFVSRLLAEKGVFETIDAFALLRERCPSRLVIAGDGPVAGKVAAHIRSRGLMEHVTLAGHLPSDRLADLYRRADVFVLPTYHPEGFPTVLSEAMGAGLPIVTTKTRGIADHLNEGINALFVPPRDSAATAEALERLLTDSTLRERMSVANRSKVKKFAPETVARTYLRALREICSS